MTDKMEIDLALLKKDVEHIGGKVDKLEWWGKWAVILIAGYVFTQILDTAFAQKIIDMVS